MTRNRQLHSGEWIEVRSKEEILQTLDKKGQLEGLPFMPQMFEYSGQRFRVYKRAHKTCDTVNDYKGRRMKNAVHLEGVRCDGAAHGGCEAACLIFWKEAWLKRVVEPPPPAVPGLQEPRAGTVPLTQCSIEDVWAGTKRDGGKDGEPTYVCQATQVPAATEPLAWWSLGQYLEDFTSGNVGLRKMACGFLYMAYNGVVNSGVGAGRALRWLYDVFQRLRGGIPYPRKRGKIPAGAKTPHAELNLQVGEWVRVKSFDQVLATLDINNKNRGLYFDAEMVPYCGRSFRVLKRVKRIVDEKTGKMMHFKNPCIILDGVVCQSRYSECRLFCPRSIYSYWREIWLERISPSNSDHAFVPSAKCAELRTAEVSCKTDDRREQIQLHRPGVSCQKLARGLCTGAGCSRI